MIERKILNFVNKSNNENPMFADVGSSGFDLRAYINEENGGIYNYLLDEYEITLQPMERRMIHTGIYFEVPSGCEIQVRPRSGMSINRGLTLINAIGTLDESYTGECCILMINLSQDPKTIVNGDRVAQAVLMPVYNGNLVALTKIDEITKKTERGSGGFGHSGIR